MKKRLLAIAMTLAMTLSLLPVTALAEGGTPELPPETVSEVQPDTGTGDDGEADATGITTENALTDAIEAASNGGTVKLDGDITVTKPIVINKTLKLDLNGKTISNTSDIWSGNNWSLLEVAGGNLTITGEGKFQGARE